MYTLIKLLVLFSMYFMAMAAYVPLRVKRTDDAYNQETHPLDNSRRGILKLTDKIKFTIADSINLPKEQPKKTMKSVSLSDLFNTEGMLFLTQPTYNEVRVLNKAINKAIALKNAGSVSKDTILSSQELQVLDNVVAGLSGNNLRAKNQQEPGLVYNFQELVV